MKILFGVFDWGLGHATRDTPLIEELLKRKHCVDIISTGRALALLKSRFGKRCNYFDVPSIHVPYSNTRFFSLFFVKNIPKMLMSLNRARRITEEIILKNNYDKVISDCRYDVYDGKDNSYFINHQLRFISLPGAQGFVEKWLHNRMENYKLIIVPDFDKPNLTGDLSHNLKYIQKSKIRYIGILSHIRKLNCPEDISLFVSISGPEPQRTVLENKLLPLLNKFPGKIVVGLGKPELKHRSSRGRILFYSFLDSVKQEEYMNRARMVITRSGYTTMMELAELGKAHALLIPTPGQTEQEYLADIYEQRGYFHHVDQSEISLEHDLKKASKLNGFKVPWKTKKSIEKFIAALSE